MNPIREVLVRFHCTNCHGTLDKVSGKPFDEPLPNGWVTITFRHEDTKLAITVCSPLCVIKVMNKLMLEYPQYKRINEQLG